MRDQLFSALGIRKYLGCLKDRFYLDLRESVPSTNLILKEQAPSLREWTVVIAREQTAGRGRRGRSFYSPAGTGAYISILLRPRIAPTEAVLITSAAACAVSEAIEECSSQKAGIKWVNDVFVADRKVCGILTEASYDTKSELVDYAILGMGINIIRPRGGFPPEIADTAGAIFAEDPGGDIPDRLIASILTSFMKICEHLSDRTHIPEYRARNFLLGRDIIVTDIRGGHIPARALDIDSDCRLVVRYADGSTETLSTGDVSVRPASP